MSRMRERSALEVVLVFLKLGVTSFGGPIAHIGYFREEFVVRRRWIEDAAFTDLVALCQFLPGPASSQIGFSLGIARAGYGGGLAAWAGFTLPSAVLMTLFALGAPQLGGRTGSGILHGLQLVAVAIVAQAVFGMARTLCPDRARASIACVAALIVIFSGSGVAQSAAIVMGGLAGLWLCTEAVPLPMGSLDLGVSRRTGAVALVAFFLLLLALPRWAAGFPVVAVFDAFYHAGALVFGGGHVVLPLLSDAFVTPGRVTTDAFLAGYGAAQALPGPLFTFAAYLGAVVAGTTHAILGAALGLAGIFLPGLLILVGALPFWDDFRKRVGARAIMQGINAAVVGLLCAALYGVLWTSTVKSSADFAMVLSGFILLVAWRAPPLLIVILGSVGGAASM